ncbi:hypothetical protein VTN02DRAFT_6800 [Thermoascus thermophilus]
MAAVPNYLSFQPRPVPKDRKCFENDGPGSLSSAGVRHDNDFVNVRDIRILPTTDEILSLRAPYMPYKRFNKPHFLERGPERIIDTLFRQLRHDNVERLKDCVYAAAQKLCSTDAPPEDYDPCQETPAGNQYYMYWGAEFEDLRFDDRKGLIVQFSYNCPKSMRRRKMFTSGRFEKGMLMAAVGIDDDGVSLSATFFEIFLPQCTESMEIRGGNGVKAAVQLLFAQKECEEDITRMVFYAQKINTGRFVLIEFPKHLLSGFYPILKRIQEFSSRDFAFTRYFAPRNLEEENIGSFPPSYVDQETSFLDCNAIRKNNERHSHLEKHPLRDLIKDKKKFLEIVKSETTLDEGQAEAFVETLTNEIAFVQGPPGTGKTFLGVALTKAILAAGKSGEKPIIAVCMTNHALDSFLKDLVDQGITQIARLGCGSKEEWTAKYSLRSLVTSVKSTERERIERCKALHEVRHDGLHKKGLDRRAGAFPYVFWSSGGDLKVFDMSLAEEFALFLGRNDPDGKSSLTNSDIVSNVLCDIVSKIHTNSQWAEENIWKLPFTERKALIARWAKEIDPKAVARNIIDIHFKHQEAVNQLKDTRHSADLRCLEKQKVIGMTTTACASNRGLLQRLNPEVVICEEAGEVMEAHTLCTLFPSLKHAIFIGDPLQLRPQISEQSLSLETKNGQDYRLDESLFERLMDPNSGIRTLPHSRLTIQRRMHPDISDCVRKTLYPFLVDHPSTYTHPEVGGLSHRTFWLDHNAPEEKSAASSRTTKSFCNQFEVEMLAQLVRSLHSTASLYLSDQDKATLLDEGFLEEKDLESEGRLDVDMIDMLRLSTIDNFQGEEAKIVILSTVRSNVENRPGFLKTSNRINVACSRARDGFYIFGSSKCLGQVPMWKDIINIFQESDRLGGSLHMTPCSREPKHCHTVFEIKEPSDFDNIPPCEATCGATLSCGHTCTEKCHPPELHETDSMKCKEPCNKTHPDCGHLCEKACGEDCGTCTVEKGTTNLDCGHVGVVTCDIDYWGVVPKCNAIVREYSPVATSAKANARDARKLVIYPALENATRSSRALTSVFSIAMVLVPALLVSILVSAAVPTLQSPQRDICPVLSVLVLSPVQWAEIPKLAEVADKLITKMAQYIGILGKRLTNHEVMLRNSFPSLKQGLRSSPLGFAANQQLISERFRGLTEVQDHIVAIRENLVIPAEENLGYLMQFYRDQDLIPTYNLQFKLRFDLLFRRARHAFLKDVLEIVKVLKTFNDPSYPVEFLAASLCSTVKVHGQDNIDNLTKPIVDCVSKRLPCLEVELRLLQLSFQCLLQAAADVDGSSRRYIYSDASMKRVLNLCQMYPHTAGLYKQQAESIKISLKTGKSPGPIFMEQTRAAEKKWRECVPGSITTCTESHPYPAAAFENCPECGKKVISEEPNYEQHLHENKFLDWMRNRASAGSPKE